MTNLEEHKRKIREHLKGIGEALDDGIENRPATLGFHASACAVELLEVYLHKKNLISTGKTLKHNWFERPKPEQKILPLAERKIKADFPGKEKIYPLIYNIEDSRDILIYGRSTPAQIRFVLDNFLKLRKLMEEKLREEGEEIA